MFSLAYSHTVLLLHLLAFFLLKATGMFAGPNVRPSLVWRRIKSWTPRVTLGRFNYRASLRHQESWGRGIPSYNILLIVICFNDGWSRWRVFIWQLLTRHSVVATTAIHAWKPILYRPDIRDMIIITNRLLEWMQKYVVNKYFCA